MRNLSVAMVINTCIAHVQYKHTAVSGQLQAVHNTLKSERVIMIINVDGWKQEYEQ